MLYVILLCLVTSILMIVVTIVKPRIKIKSITIGSYWVVTLLGAILLLVLGFISLNQVWQGLTSSGTINPIKILVMFISITILSIFLDETGFFKWLANVVLKKAGNSQLKLFTALYLLISVVTIFTSNDIIILTFTPFICYFAKNAKVNAIPYLVAEFVAANTLGMVLLIGNPTNIYLGTAKGIDFISYLQVMALPALFASVMAYFVMMLLFRKTLKEQIIGVSDEVEIKDKTLLVISLSFLAVCTGFLVISSYINLQMWLIAVIGAVSLSVLVVVYSIVKKVRPNELFRTYKRAPWELIPFVISMFVLVLALESSGVTVKMAELLGDSNPIIVYGVSSTLFANLINNIPMSVLFSSVIQNVSPHVLYAAVYATIIGSNVSALLTPIGALAGIVWLSLIKEHKIEYSFKSFFKHGVIITVPVLMAALVGLMISLSW